MADPYYFFVNSADWRDHREACIAAARKFPGWVEIHTCDRVGDDSVKVWPEDERGE